LELKGLAGEIVHTEARENVVSLAGIGRRRSIAVSREQLENWGRRRKRW